MSLNPSREAVRKALEARAGQLRRELGEALHDGPEDPGAGLPNRNLEVDDAAVAEIETALDIASARRDAQELEEVLAALSRVDGPGFDRCVDCGERIPAARLAAKPQALRCVDCERRVESAKPGGARAG